MTIDAIPKQSVLQEFTKLYEKMVESPTISIADGKEIHVLKIEDIVYCTGGGNYSTVMLKDKREIVTSKKMMYFEEQLTKHDFLRIHKSHLINFAHINSVSKVDGLSISMSNGVLLPVSRNRKQELMDRINLI
ncbi:LytR/AlgR family response regulator transcription factor [Kordia jejudonensis]|uniref:LytR/AlgR family response regulator transcription factor n=1 Tax=Kordia jejudonensis TaxID=1348245 RepID=UPI000629AA3D|nr:LytTR family DNA-binding domain-containing protein [Kordia jejudonensis]